MGDGPGFTCEGSKVLSELIFGRRPWEGDVDYAGEGRSGLDGNCSVEGLNYIIDVDETYDFARTEVNRHTCSSYQGTQKIRYHPR